MRRAVPTLAGLLGLAGPAAAHPGHIADLAGHDHWVAGAALGAAVIAAIWGALKGRKTEAEAETEGDEAADEAADASAEEARA